MFGFGKKKDSLDDLGFSSNDGLNNFGQSDNNNNNNQGNNSIPSDDPLSNSFLDNPAPSSNDFSDPNNSMGQDSMSKPFHPSEFNNSLPDSVSSTAPSTVQDSKPADTFGNFNGVPSYHQMELISSKLDVLKAMIENLSQRVSSLESKIDLEKSNQRKGW